MELSSRKIIGLLAEQDRRRVVAAMILGATEVGQITDRAGIDERAAVAALDRLTKSGLVEASGDGTFLLLEQAFQMAARSEAEPPPPSNFADRPASQRKVLDRAFDNRRLIRLPSKHSHRVVVLDELAQRFEPGEKYTENQVNALLTESDIDVATLRRNLVDHGMLDRAGGAYWRSGGTVPVD